MKPAVRAPMRLATTITVAWLTTGAGLAETVPFGSDRWEVIGGESRIEQHLDRESLYLKGGLAWLKDVEFLDGVLEFDVAVTGERGFMGGIWRAQDSHNYEEFYIRPHQSGNPDANQYTPVFNGLPGWQLYHGDGYGAPVAYRTDRWMHVRIVVSGTRGEVYIDSDEPVVRIHEMKRPVVAGRIGVICANFASAHFSNFSYSVEETPALRGPAASTASAEDRAGLIRQWEISSPFDERFLKGKYVLTDKDVADLVWEPAPAETAGILNLAAFRSIGQGSDTAFVRATVRSERAQVKKLSFGYSDRVRAYFNGRLVYGGTNLYRSRDYRFLGTIGFFDDLYLPLREGDNEIWFAVSESFGGWGIQGRFENMDGIEIPSGTTFTETEDTGPTRP